MGNEHKLALIGPISPFRGGIAQHTTALSRALSDKTELLTISFTRMYPRVIFPGKSDREPEADSKKESGVRYLIDSINPLTWHKAINEIIEYGADTVIIPWWTWYWAFCFGYIAWKLKKKGIKVIFFCHNSIDHEAATWKFELSRRALSKADVFVAQTLHDRNRLRDHFPDIPVHVHPHPIYDQFPEAREGWPKRGRLELLFFGLIRSYKGLDALIDAMAMTTDGEMLTIAGEVWSGEKETLNKIEGLGLSNQVELRPWYHTEAEVAELFARCDVVVLPYRTATGSGIIPLAYHYNKPVIVTRVGGLPDMVEDKETGWIVEPGDRHQLAETIRKATRAQCRSMAHNIRQFKKTITWETLAQTIIQLG